MIKTKRRREREDPPKDTVFALRGRPIDPKDIARFEKRAIKRGLITQEDDLSGQGKFNLLSSSTLANQLTFFAESLEDLVFGTPPTSGW